MNKIQLTSAYVKAFNDKNIDAILSLCDDNIYLKDPDNELFSKEEFRMFLLAFFKNNISFTAKQIITDNQIKDGYSAIHFKISINDKNFNGVDIIEWKGSKIASLIAYL
jgi:hypothetical protein